MGGRRVVVVMVVCGGEDSVCVCVGVVGWGLCVSACVCLSVGGCACVRVSVYVSQRGE